MLALIENQPVHFQGLAVCCFACT